jgi:hypothetical protein
MELELATFFRTNQCLSEALRAFIRIAVVIYVSQSVSLISQSSEKTLVRLSDCQIANIKELSQLSLATVLE